MVSFFLGILFSKPQWDKWYNKSFYYYKEYYQRHPLSQTLWVLIWSGVFIFGFISRNFMLFALVAGLMVIIVGLYILIGTIRRDRVIVEQASYRLLQEKGKDKMTRFIYIAEAVFCIIFGLFFLLLGFLSF